MFSMIRFFSISAGNRKGNRDGNIAEARFEADKARALSAIRNITF